MTYEECLSQITEGSVINFREYSLDRKEKRHLSLELESGMVQRVFLPNEQLSIETLQQYYGEELEDTVYLQLSQMNCLRVVVILGVEPDGTQDIKILQIVKDFVDTGLQQLEVINQVSPDTAFYEPNYVEAQKGWSVS